MKLLTWLLITATLVSCLEKKDDDDSPIKTLKLTDGTYVSDCLDKGSNTSEKVSAVVTNSSNTYVEIIENYTVDSTCSTLDYTEKYTHQFSITGVKITITLSTYEKAPNNGTAATWNGLGYCSFNGWNDGTFADVTGIDCDSDGQQPNQGDVQSTSDMTATSTTITLPDTHTVLTKQ